MIRVALVLIGIKFEVRDKIICIRFTSWETLHDYQILDLEI
jgi:hypothetical protein